MRKNWAYNIGMHLLNSLNWVRMYLIVSKSKIQNVLRSRLSFIITSGTIFLAWAHRMTHCLQRVNILRKKIKSTSDERIFLIIEIFRKFGASFWKTVEMPVIRVRYSKSLIFKEIALRNPILFQFYGASKNSS